MLFLMQSYRAILYAPILPRLFAPLPVVDMGDDEILLAWFAYMQRYYGR